MLQLLYIECENVLNIGFGREKVGNIKIWIMIPLVWVPKYGFVPVPNYHP
jgi:hypothetical protein